MKLTQPAMSQDALAAFALDHERVLVVTGARSGLTIIVAVHSTVLGPALGGCRVWQYDAWTDALLDALRLSSAMTLKNSAAGLNRGGGKAVVFLPRGTVLSDGQKRDAMLDLGDAVESLDGAYITAEDVGTNAGMMAAVAERTKHVCGLPPEQGGIGEPADATAAGVYASILSTLNELFGSPSVQGKHLVVAGLGQVGGRLVRRLADEGAKLTVADVDLGKRALAAELGADWADPSDAHRVDADIFVPCGLGGVLNETVIGELRVRGVVGAANNQLATPAGAEQMAARGILWAPDFVVNGGGVIYLALLAGSEPGSDEPVSSLDEVMARVDGIGDAIARIFAVSKERGITTLAAAEALAHERLDAGH